jgi:hypothetical protein
MKTVISSWGKNDSGKKDNSGGSYLSKEMKNYRIKNCADGKVSLSEVCK